MKTEIKQSLRVTLLNADLGLTLEDFANHESDLYIVDKPGVSDWIRKNWVFAGERDADARRRMYSHFVRPFISQEGSNWNGAGKRCLDVTFAHDPDDGAWKIQAYRNGNYAFPAPPVTHANWNESDWIRYINAHGHWTK